MDQWLCSIKNIISIPHILSIAFFCLIFGWRDRIRRSGTQIVLVPTSFCSHSGNDTTLPILNIEYFFFDYLIRKLSSTVISSQVIPEISTFCKWNENQPRYRISHNLPIEMEPCKLQSPFNDKHKCHHIIDPPSPIRLGLQSAVFVIFIFLLWSSTANGK